MTSEVTKPFGHANWRAEGFLGWATISELMGAAGVPLGARVLDVGCGVGWTTVFLAESGYRPLGVDLVPANVEVGRERAARWGVDAEFVAADMETLDLGERRFDAALIFDALHHSTRQAAVLSAVGRHLEPGAGLVLGEPSAWHRFSPFARKVQRELGWHEGAVGVRRLRRELRAAGFDAVRRHVGPTRPVPRRAGALLGQMARLGLAGAAVGPGQYVWVTARRSG